MDLKLFVRAHWDRILGWALVALGGIALFLGWIGVSGTALTYKQIPYVVSGGLVGIALVGDGATLLLTAELRDEWRKLDSLEDVVKDAVEGRVFPVPADERKGESVTAAQGDGNP